MEFIQIKGNTWCLADWQLIPFYKTDETHCILLDTGLISQRENIEQALLENGIKPVGILGSHAHTDHSPNHHYFKEKYQIPVALSAGEALISRNPLLLKAYYYMLSPRQLLSYPEYAQMLVEVDRMIMPDETQVEFCGAVFDIIHTPGHSPDHIAIGTPDGVLYLGDAVLSGPSLTGSKLPYFFSISYAIQTLHKLRCVDYPCYVTAHRGIHEELTDLLKQNEAVLKDVTNRLCRMIDHPVTLSEAIGIICQELSLLSSRAQRSVYYERNIRTYLEYMTDEGLLELRAEKGVTYYCPVE